MKISIVGFRGIPANYGGFETFVEELAPRLVQRGHEVTVYGRSNVVNYQDKYYKGVKLVILPTISHKYLDTIVHTLLSIIHCSFCSYDVLFVLNAANSPFALIPRLAGKKVVLNVDGIERLRKKWNCMGRSYYRVGEYLATKLAHVIVADAEVIRGYYLETYKKESAMIPYGANIEEIDSRGILEKFGLQPNEYILYVSRLEPENNAHLVIEAFKSVKTKKKLAIVGDAPYSAEYKQQLRKMGNGAPRIIFTGFVFGRGYKELQCNAYCYIQATEVGGTHPALIEAMGFGNCVIANGTPENIEVVGNAGIIYEKNNIEDLRNKVEQVVRNPGIIRLYGDKAKGRIKAHYSWDTVVDKYERLFLKLAT